MRFVKSEAGAVVLWVLASVLLAAAISPWLYGLGKDFAVQYVDDGGLFGKLAGSCERAKFTRYFNRSLMLSALLLFWPLWWRVRMLGRVRGRGVSIIQGGVGWKIGLIHCLVGFTVAAGLLWVLGIAAHVGGAFAPVEKVPAAGEFISKGLVPALGASIAEEWLFRALLMGLWLRISGPVMACVGTSLVFAFVHFLEPPHGVLMSEPRAWTAGFELLGLVMQNYLSPQFIAAELLTLFVVGMALGWARLRTDSLWLPIGMHAGWIFAFKSSNMLHAAVEENALGSLWIGGTLRAGLLPLATLLVTWFVLMALLRVITRHRTYIN